MKKSKSTFSPQNDLTETDQKILYGDQQAALKDSVQRRIKIYLSCQTDMDLELNNILSYSLPKIQSYAASKDILIDLIYIRSVITKHDINNHK